MTNALDSVMMGTRNVAQTSGSAATKANQSQGFDTVFKSQQSKMKTDTEKYTNEEINTSEEDTSSKDTTDIQAVEHNTNDKSADNTNEIQKNETNESVETSKDETSTDALEEESELTEAMVLLQTAIQDVKDYLQQELGLTSEELTSLMDELGMSEEDLLSSVKLSELLVAAAGGEDMASLITNEDLYQQLLDARSFLEGTMNNVSEESDLSEDELSQILRSLKELGQSIETVEEPVETIEIANNVVKSSETVTNVDNTNVKAQTITIDTSKEDTSSHRDMNQSGNESAMNQAQTTFTQNLTLEQAQRLAETENSSFSLYDSEDIMNQITEYLEVNVKADTTELMLQLNPESLGTLQIYISAKEGIMTAQIAAQNEAVKSIIEGQLIQLQNNFEQQNIKVEAIEVSVQTNAFNENLDNSERDNAQENEKKNQTRKLNLNLLDAGEEMTEVEQILASMMAANGNSIDFTA